MRSHSITCALVFGIIFSFAALAETYKDPRQRFELEVPAGWTAEPFGEGVKIARGGSYSLVMDGGSENPEAVVSRLAGQFGGQWARFQQLKQGSAPLAGQTAQFRFYSGVSPKGVSSFLKVIAVSAQGRTLALISSSPEREFLAAKPGFDQIEQGFRLKTAAPASRLLQRGMSLGKRQSKSVVEALRSPWKAK